MNLLAGHGYIPMDGGSRAPSVERRTPPHTYADNTRHTDINNEFKVDLDDNGSLILLLIGFRDNGLSGKL